jgi:hypothetical protein
LKFVLQRDLKVKACKMRASLCLLLWSEHFVHRKVNTGRPDLQTHGRTAHFQSKHNHRHDLFFFKLRNSTTTKLHYKRCSYSVTHVTEFVFRLTFIHHASYI